MFLADRYIKGECPNCHAKDQYGDACENCSTVYSPTDLINPYSTLSGAAPVRKQSDHYFFRLSDPRCVEFVTSWLDASACSPPSRTRRGNGSRARAIRSSLTGTSRAMRPTSVSRSRTRPESISTCGSMRRSAISRRSRTTSTPGRRARTGRPQRSQNFSPQPEVEQIHFIGKDIIYFHTLFWPAMLQVRGPQDARPGVRARLHTGWARKMSKSRGTGISPLRYLEIGMNPEWLRYYIAAKLNANVEDFEFNAGRLHGARQQRPRRQVRQHRQSHRTVSCEVLRQPDA